MSEEIKPCPFCGDKPVFAPKNFAGTELYLYCKDCWVGFEVQYCDLGGGEYNQHTSKYNEELISLGKQYLLDKWNTRNYRVRQQIKGDENE